MADSEALEKYDRLSRAITLAGAERSRLVQFNRKQKVGQREGTQDKINQLT